MFGSDKTVIAISDGFLFLDSTQAKLAESELLKKFPETKWQVFPKIVPPVEENGFLLESASGAQLDEIKQFLRHHSGDGAIPEVNRWKGSFRVVYANDADISELKRALHKNKFKDKPLLVGEFCHSDCIRVSNLTETVTSDTIKQALFNVERCRITYVDISGKTALVYFANYEDASHVLKKLKTSKYEQVAEELSNPKVNFNLHYHHSTEEKPKTTSADTDKQSTKELPPSQPLSKKQKSLSNRDPLTQALPDSPKLNSIEDLKTGLKDKGTITRSFELDLDVPIYILKLVHKSANLGKMLAAKFKTVKAEVTSKTSAKMGAKPVQYVVKITLPEDEKVIENYILDGAVFKEKCAKRACDFFAEFVTKSAKFDFDRLSDFRFKMGWDQKDESVISIKSNNGVTMKVHASWSNVDKGKVEITGLQVDVDAFLKKLKDATAKPPSISRTETSKQDQHAQLVPKMREKSSVKLETHVSTWFYKFAVKDESSGKLFDRVEIKMSADNEEIYLYGQQQDCMRAKHWIEEMASQLIKEQYDVSGELKTFLETSPGRQHLSEVESRTNCSVTIECDIQSAPTNSHLPQIRSNKYPLAPSVPGLILCTRKLKDCDVIVRVTQVDITQMSCDAIVNTSNSQLQLRYAGVSGSILQKDGGSIQQEMNEIIRQKRFIPPGESVTTGPGVLPCKKIIHTVGPNLYGLAHMPKDSERCLMRCVMSVLREAEANGVSSIAIPAISCGAFGGNPDKCTSLIVEGIVEFFATAYKSCIRTIDLVELCDEYTLFLFKQALETVSTPQEDDSFHFLQDSSDQERSNKSPSSNNPNSIKIGPITVSVKLGDITNEHCDAIVNPMAQGYRFDLGVVSRAVLSRGGKQIERQCHSHFQKKHASPDFRVTGAGSLPSGHIFHLLMPLQQDKLVVVLTEMLLEADKRQKQTIAIPAVGTGGLALSTEDCTKIIKQAIHNVTTQGVTYLREIRIVIFDSRRLQSCINVLCSETKKGLSSTSSFSNNLSPKSSTDMTCAKICGKTTDDVKKAWTLLKAYRAKKPSAASDQICVDTMILSSDENFKYDEDIFKLQDECNVSFEIVIRRKETILKMKGKRRDVETALGLVKRMIGQKRLRPANKVLPNASKITEERNHYATASSSPDYSSLLSRYTSEKGQVFGVSQSWNQVEKSHEPAIASGCGHSDWNYNSNNTAKDTMADWSEHIPTTFGSSTSAYNTNTSTKSKEDLATRQENSEKTLQKLRSAQGRMWRDKKREELRTQPHTNINTDRQVSGGREWNHWKLLETDNWVLEELERGTAHYKKIVGCFSKGSTFLKTVKSVEEVKNPKLYQKFEREKRGNSHGYDDTVEMYYGVKYEARSKYICQNGWNSDAELRSRPNEGTTFQASSAMAVSDAGRDSQGNRRMFLAYVVKGRGGNTAGNTRTVYRNASAYPAYLLTFKAY
uniref:Poly [ADP-ribose] polymerase 14 n=1 Tax=Phallusia mammillata TaxID=59560 RepID=A0A6F9DNT9_9ASCI|nr:poly [ADP-ribose] polymerase 14 [Phallusia mammillata]